MAGTEETPEVKTEAKKGGPKSLADVYKGYQDKAAKTPEKVHKVNLTKLFNVEFTADFRGFKKGHKLTNISQVMRDLYVSNGVAKEFTPDVETESED
ncbi:hypothetical protein [Epilithonimonas caeni]|uniref:hypothetical protein n=1 Tax=Epilithonimonas caeni TaxID=365343 RepID=UPI0003F7CBED|nr:hypothetical protein [Epilithonimonas caeni]